MSLQETIARRLMDQAQRMKRIAKHKTWDTIEPWQRERFMDFAAEILADLHEFR